MTAYRGDRLTCPVCEVALEAIPAPLPVHGCVRCGGAWLGPEAAVHLLRDQDDAVTRGIVAASRRIPTDGLSHPEPERGRACAMCGQPMSKLNVGRINLETCPHGTWFDHAEVKKAHVALARRREPDVLREVLEDIVAWFVGD